jgi:hypothetical protein
MPRPWAQANRFPPVVVYRDGETNWLADGHHRVDAARRAGRTEILAGVRSGGQRDALLSRSGQMRATAFRSRARTVAAPSRDCSGMRNGANGATVRSPGTAGSIIRPSAPARARLQGNGEIPRAEGGGAEQAPADPLARVDRPADSLSHFSSCFARITFLAAALDRCGWSRPRAHVRPRSGPSASIPGPSCFETLTRVATWWRHAASAACVPWV